MNDKVKLKLIKEKVTNTYDFGHAQRMLLADKHGKMFAIAEPKKWKFDGKELIKLASE